MNYIIKKKKNPYFRKIKQTKRNLRSLGKWIVKRQGKLTHLCTKCNNEINSGELVYHYQQELGLRRKHWYECYSCAMDKYKIIPDKLKRRYNLFTPELEKCEFPE